MNHQSLFPSFQVLLCLSVQIKLGIQLYQACPKAFLQSFFFLSSFFLFSSFKLLYLLLSNPFPTLFPLWERPNGLPLRGKRILEDPFPEGGQKRSLLPSQRSERVANSLSPLNLTTPKSPKATSWSLSSLPVPCTPSIQPGS